VMAAVGIRANRRGKRSAGIGGSLERIRSGLE
jgi:hypothetical protein